MSADLHSNVAGSNCKTGSWVWLGLAYSRPVSYRHGLILLRFTVYVSKAWQGNNRMERKLTGLNWWLRTLIGACRHHASAAVPRKSLAALASRQLFNNQELSYLDWRGAGFSAKVDRPFYAVLANGPRRPRQSRPPARAAFPGLPPGPH